MGRFQNAKAGCAPSFLGVTFYGAPPAAGKMRDSRQSVRGRVPACGEIKAAREEGCPWRYKSGWCAMRPAGKSGEARSWRFGTRDPERTSWRYKICERGHAEKSLEIMLTDGRVLTLFPAAIGAVKRRRRGMKERESRP